MHRTTRMLSIILQLHGKTATLQQLASSYECSTKTIQRDINQLINIGIPVVTSRGRNGGVAIDPAWWLGPLNLSSDEIETVILAMESATFLPDRDEVLAKIRTAVRPTRFDTIADDQSRPRIWQSTAEQQPNVRTDIRRIIARDLWCRIHYRGGSNPGWRTILPEQLYIAEHRWYLNAVDERSREFRTFRLDRISGIEPTFGPPDAATIIEHARSQPTYDSITYAEVVAELTEAGLAFCKDHPRLRHRLDDGVLRFRCPPSDYPYMARDLIRMGTNCRVIAPPELKQVMLEVTLEMLRHLQE